MKKPSWLLLGLLVFTARLGFADPKGFYYDRYLERLHPHLDTWSAVQTGYFDQKVNPEDAADARTFKQRYYVDDSFASGPGAPVLFYLCGEMTCASGSLRGAIAEHAKTHRAVMVALEHRYYGISQPFPLLTTENLKFLTTDNALADAAAFQKYAQTQLGLSGKWVVIGGSYPGALSGYYRLKYPDRVVGSLASSAPVRAEANFEEYDGHVTDVIGPDCADAVRKVVTRIEAAMGDAAVFEGIKKKFQAEVLTEADDFLYLVADIGAMAAQYGYQAQFCQAVKKKDALQGYADFTKFMFQTFKMDALSDSVAGAVSLDPNDYLAVFGLRQWFYQSCTEYGYWQNAHHDPAHSVRSARINPAYHEGICRRLFGLQSAVDTTHINQTFYQPLLQAPASRIFFTNGADDPWSKLSLTADNGGAVNSALTLLTIPHSAHCKDLKATTPADSADLKAARAQFDTLIREWLR